METIEINEPCFILRGFTTEDLHKAIQDPPIVKQKVAEGNRIISKLMEKYADLNDRLNGKVPHP